MRTTLHAPRTFAYLGYCSEAQVRCDILPLLPLLLLGLTADADWAFLPWRRRCLRRPSCRARRTAASSASAATCTPPFCRHALPSASADTGRPA